MCGGYARVVADIDNPPPPPPFYRCFFKAGDLAGYCKSFNLYWTAEVPRDERPPVMSVPVLNLDTSNSTVISGGTDTQEVKDKIAFLQNTLEYLDHIKSSAPDKRAADLLVYKRKQIVARIAELQAQLGQKP